MATLKNFVIAITLGIALVYISHFGGALVSVDDHINLEVDEYIEMFECYECLHSLYRCLPPWLCHSTITCTNGTIDESSCEKYTEFVSNTLKQFRGNSTYKMVNISDILHRQKMKAYSDVTFPGHINEVATREHRLIYLAEGHASIFDWHKPLPGVPISGEISHLTIEVDENLNMPRFVTYDVEWNFYLIIDVDGVVVACRQLDPMKKVGINLVKGTKIKEEDMIILDIAYDWINKILYFANGYRGTIEAVKLTHLDFVYIIAESVNPHTFHELTVDPIGGIIAWSVYNEIYIAAQNSSFGPRLLLVANGGDILSLTADYRSGRLAFIDSFHGWLESIDYNGRQMRKLYVNKEDLSGSHYLTVHDGVYYWHSRIKHMIFVLRIFRDDQSVIRAFIDTHPEQTTAHTDDPKTPKRISPLITSMVVVKWDAVTSMHDDHRFCRETCPYYCGLTPEFRHVECFCPLNYYLEFDYDTCESMELESVHEKKIEVEKELIKKFNQHQYRNPFMYEIKRVMSIAMFIIAFFTFLLFGTQYWSLIYDSVRSFHTHFFHVSNEPAVRYQPLPLMTQNPAHSSPSSPRSSNDIAVLNISSQASTSYEDHGHRAIYPKSASETLESENSYEGTSNQIKYGKSIFKKSKATDLPPLLESIEAHNSG